MKRPIILVLAMLFVACAPTTAAKASPSQTPSASSTSSPTSSITDSLLYVRMTSLDVMWAETPTRVIRSTDRGQHWTDVTPVPHGEGGSFFALDDDRAWFVTILSPASGSDIYHTVDGGKIWARSGAALAINGPESLDFVDPIHGWATVGLGAAAGSEGVAVLRSVDGGASWSRVADTGDPTTASPSPSGLAFRCDKGAAVFGSKNVGLLPVECAGGPPYIYRTHDGGAHWTSISLPNLASMAYFGQAEFLSATDVVLIGHYYATGPVPTILVSHDAGITWQPHSLPGSASVDFESTSSGWQLDTPIQETEDGGQTWHPLSTPAPPFKASDMALQDLGKGTAVAWSSTAIYRTDDGAATWQKITPPQRQP